MPLRRQHKVKRAARPIHLVRQGGLDAAAAERPPEHGPKRTASTARPGKLLVLPGCRWRRSGALFGLGKARAVESSWPARRARQACCRKAIGTSLPVTRRSVAWPRSVLRSAATGSTAIESRHRRNVRTSLAGRRRMRALVERTVRGVIARRATSSTRRPTTWARPISKRGARACRDPRRGGHGHGWR